MRYAKQLKLTIRFQTVRFHRMIEPSDHGYWDGPDGAFLDIVQLDPRGPWHIRRVGFEPTDFGDPMTLREALVRVKLGVA